MLQMATELNKRGKKVEKIIQRKLIYEYFLTFYIFTQLPLNCYLNYYENKGKLLNLFKEP